MKKEERLKKEESVVFPSLLTSYPLLLGFHNG